MSTIHHNHQTTANYSIQTDHQTTANYSIQTVMNANPDAPGGFAAPFCSASVWMFDEAPKDLRDLSTNGGDEDWLVELPPGWENYGTPFWIEAMDSCRDPSHYPHPTRPGWKVIIGAHA